MTEVEWMGATDPKAMCSCIPCNSHQRKARLFLVSCCRRLLDLIPEGPVRDAMRVAEAFADEQATDRARQKAQRDVAAAPIPPGDASINATNMVREATKKTITAKDIDSHTGATARGYAARKRGKEQETYTAAFQAERSAQAVLLRDIFGNPFRPVTFDPVWRTTTAVLLARQMYESCDFSAMPILADALQDAGCDDPDVLTHCRLSGLHVRGCWVIDLVLLK
jgi:hypothetical protein